MGNRGKPRGASDSAADNLLPTGVRRAAGPAGGRTRAERRKLNPKDKRTRTRTAVPEIPQHDGDAVQNSLV
ncbi:signal peptidase I, partial [Streptomyces sp. NPDC057052]